MWRLGGLWGKMRPALARGERGPAAMRAATEQPRRGLRSLFAAFRGRTLHLLRNFGNACLARQLRKLLARGTFDLYHEPNTIPLPCDYPTVATVHDLSVFLHPEWHPAGRVAHFEKHFLASLERTEHFITVSEFTRREMIQRLSVAPERVTRVYNGIRPDLAPMEDSQVAPALHRLGLPPRYLLYVGTI